MLGALLLVLSWQVAQAAASDLGIVFLHGKESTPRAKIYVSLLETLQHAGFRIKTPTSAWARDRIYDADVDTSMAEIEREVSGLRGEGAQRVVLVGHSMGVNAALRYAATHPIDGIVALAPGHSPEFLVKQLGSDVARARQLVRQGKGGEKADFRDINVGHDLTVNTTAAIYLSWLDPDGSAVMPRNAALIKTPLPVLMIVGSKDPVTRSQDYIFGRLPVHPLSRFVTLDVDHKDVPDAGAGLVADWLSAL
jgi:pimeloyl-ACP methyl ester carboxylesterase